MPMLFPGRKPDHIPRPNLFDGAAVKLGPSRSRSHDERLPQRMGVPGCACSRLERDARAGYERRIRCLK